METAPTSTADDALLASLRDYLASYAAGPEVARITVVANAPLAASTERRDLIESSDLVLRCNSFVLDEADDEPCLGRRTNVVVLAPNARVTRWFFEGYRDRAYMLVNNTSRQRTLPRFPGSFPDDLGYWPVPGRPLGIPLKRLLRPEENGRGAVPTTGTTAAYLAYVLFPDAELNLTGFSFLHDREQTRWAHHWGTEVPVSASHLLDREADLLQSWIDEGRARFIP